MTSIQPPPTPVLSLRNLSKRFGRHYAVNDLSFDVQEGDIFGFLGPNGAGKSTTMYMITGLVRPTSGAMELFGTSYDRGPAARAQMGALIETPAFYEYMSARKNLEVLAKTQGGVPHGRIDDALARVGLADRANSVVREYSHGMKQRLGIAQALLHRPKLLLLDEPTNGLDPDGSAQVWEILRGLVRDEKMTVVVSSHLLHEVEENCNRIAVINQGILVACDYVKSLLFFNKEDHLLVFDDTQRRAAAAAWLDGKPGIEILTPEHTAPTPEGEQELLVRLRQGIATEIVSGLAQAGCAPRAVVPQRKNLKQFFLELTRRQGE
jgi:ABC-2 type transport system ATP-binding protein